ncbi:MAG: biosynthetic-type acetolactate synthase large subunit [Planctomycetia bacterium]|nr:biosynthetic-type acetolactate synthase large subunit [Planctomycetia bacterium]
MSKPSASTKHRSEIHAIRPALGADVVVQSLVNHGVDLIFSYPGGSVIPLHQALTRFHNQIRVVLPRHEQGGGFAAQGYARSTGKVGVCTATSGPGAANLLTPVADAKLDSVPMVIITGQVGTKMIGTDAFQELPATEVFRSVTKHHTLITDPNDISRVMKEAFYIANTGRKGPVLVDIPKDILTATITPDYDAEICLPGFIHPVPKPSKKDIYALLEAIRGAKRPVICAGGGVAAADAAAELRSFVKKTGIPVAMTLPALGVFPYEDPLSLNLLGMHGSVYANHAVHECDLLISLGCRFVDRITGNVQKFAPHAQLAHVDIDLSEINKVCTASISILGDIKEVLTEINRKVLPPETSLEPWIQSIREWRKTDPLAYESMGEDIAPQHAISMLDNLTREYDPIIATGVGQHQMWTAQFFKFSSPRRWLSSCGMGTMGFGLPAGMGAKLANPDKMVIVVDGDGSSLMNIQEMATCFCEKIPVKVMLLNNQHLGMVVQWEDRFFSSNRGHTYLGPIDNPEATGKGTGIGPEIRYPDFVQIAKGFGWQGRSIRYQNELESGLKEMIDADGPYILDVAVPYQEHVMPMIPAGGSFNDIIRK